MVGDLIVLPPDFNTVKDGSALAERNRVPYTPRPNRQPNLIVRQIIGVQEQGEAGGAILQPVFGKFETGMRAH